MGVSTEKTQANPGGGGSSKTPRFSPPQEEPRPQEGDPGWDRAPHAGKEGPRGPASTAVRDRHSRDGAGHQAAGSGLGVPGTVGVPGQDTVHAALIDAAVGSGNPPDAP